MMIFWEWSLPGCDWLADCLGVCDWWLGTPGRQHPVTGGLSLTKWDHNYFLPPTKMFRLLLLMFCLNPSAIWLESRLSLSPGWKGRSSRLLRSTGGLRRPLRSLTHTAKCRRWLGPSSWRSLADHFRFIYSPECLGIMSKRSTESESSTSDDNIETSKAPEENQEEEKLLNRRHILRRLLAITKPQNVEDQNQGLTLEILMVRQFVNSQNVLKI